MPASHRSVLLSQPRPCCARVPVQGGLRGGFGHIAVNTPDVDKFSDTLDKVV